MSTMSEQNLEDARKQLDDHERAVESAIGRAMPRAGPGVEIRGSYPVMVARGEPDEVEEETTSTPYQLQAVIGPESISFLRGRVQAGLYLVIPTIGGIAVDDVPAPTLPRLGGGGQIFAKYTFTLDPLTAPYDWADVFGSCELVQVGLADAPPAPTRVAIGAVAGVPATQGIVYAFLTAYDEQGQILTYGYNSVLPPDPDDDFPTEFVVFMRPQIEFVE